MEAHNPLEADDYEYGVPQKDRRIPKTPLTYVYSYEGLPPKFSLANNMLAGAFAGIAVSSALERKS